MQKYISKYQFISKFHKQKAKLTKMVFETIGTLVEERKKRQTERMNKEEVENNRRVATNKK